MGELVRNNEGFVRKTDRAGMQRADTAVDAALLRGTAAVHYAAHRVYRETVSQMVAETKAIPDDTTFDLVAPHAEATAEQLGGRLLEIADRATVAMEERADVWRHFRH